MNAADAPLGIFDSGVGGLTVARAVIDQLPHEPVLYLGDTAHQPYGLKPIADVRKYALDCLDDLVDSGWTLTVAGWLLREEGSGPVHPFALAATSGRDG